MGINHGKNTEMEPTGATQRIQSGIIRSLFGSASVVPIPRDKSLRFDESESKIESASPMQSFLVSLNAIGVLGLLIHSSNLRAGDQPQWGERGSRNMISRERHLPDTFDPTSGVNIKWIIPLGTETHTTPVVSDGRVYIGTNNGNERDPKHRGDRGVLMCVDEKGGQLLWQLVVPKREEDPYLDWPNTGIASAATVDKDRVYIVSNRGEVICLDARGMANGNGGPFGQEGAHMTQKGTAQLEPGALDADILWIYDMVSEAGIWTHDGAHSSILVDGPYLYVNTGTGVDNTHRKVRTPDAPSLIVLDKTTGRLVARDREGIAPHIFHCTWSSPSIGDLSGRKVIFFAGGNGIVYAFDPVPSLGPKAGSNGALKKLWQYDFDPAGPKEDVHRFTSNRREGPSNIYGMPVYKNGRLYVAGGGDLWWGKNEAFLKCVSAVGTGDVTTTATIWTYPLEKHCLSTPAIHDGMVFMADSGKRVHCVDAATGKPFWSHEAKGDFWASPMVADGKVYIGSRRGDFLILEASRKKRLLASIELGSPISGSATPANGVVYVATMTQLYAVAQGAKLER